jgi:hypothetical protein
MPVACEPMKSGIIQRNVVPKRKTATASMFRKVNMAILLVSVSI